MGVVVKSRRLSDLFLRGKNVVVGDGAGDPVTVWMQKLNGVDRESVLRRAHAAKAKFMIEADVEDSDLFQSMYAQVRSAEDRPGLIRLIVSEDLGKYRQRVEAELAGDEETWGKDGYLQGLVDAWIGDDDNPGLAEVRVEDPDDAEAKRVIDEIDRFEAEVMVLVQAESERLEADWVDVPDEQVWRRASHRILAVRGEEIFKNEFERQQLFYCVRDPEAHTKRYFGTVAEIDDLEESVQATLVSEYNRLIVDPIEGKDLRASQLSSTSSESTSEEEASPASGLQVVNG